MKPTSALPSPLLVAADCGDLPRVEAFIRSSIASEIGSVIDDLDAPHPHDSTSGYNRGGTPLHYACRSGHESVVRTLLEHGGVDVNKTDAESWNALHYAAFNGHTAIVKLLLAFGADATPRTTYERATAIEFAAHRGFADVVAALLPYTSSLHPNQRDLSIISERKKEMARCREKYLRGEGTNAFLFRYELCGSEPSQCARNKTEMETFFSVWCMRSSIMCPHRFEGQYS